jgi:hypothetical protein
MWAGHVWGKECVGTAASAVQAGAKPGRTQRK